MVYCYSRISDSLREEFVRVSASNSNDSNCCHKSIADLSSINSRRSHLRQHCVTGARMSNLCDSSQHDCGMTVTEQLLSTSSATFPAAQLYINFPSYAAFLFCKTL